MPTISVQITLKGIQASEHGEAKELAYVTVCDHEEIWNLLDTLAGSMARKEWFFANAKSYRECNDTFTVVIP